jgi:deoxyribodipyrimidine photolyase
MIVLFIFRRDLRTVDNTTLNHIKTKYPNASILPIFIYASAKISLAIPLYSVFKPLSEASSSAENLKHFSYSPLAKLSFASR